MSILTGHRTFARIHSRHTRCRASITTERVKRSLTILVATQATARARTILLITAPRITGRFPVVGTTSGPGYNHKRLGNPTFNLNPQPGTNMCTPLRDEMRIHADSATHPGDASDGCIVCKP